ncbi:hypothetical protein FLAG1_01282 [Fusarium langsethiae]|uniref:Uncharacterized protein n=1 Tax=Fusarium langsethiae TaxID=179993 RepID=A0A0M9F473_FUSLA|nr:hypothetical protein FLAG1_01282 [Fusarium langsethiae]GKT98521.1 unnamed protein product [Fusarium langsethiae]
MGRRNKTGMGHRPQALEFLSPNRTVVYDNCSRPGSSREEKEVIRRYDSEEACKRLEKYGYHPLVTSKSVSKVLEGFSSKVKENEKRAASRDEFLKANKGKPTHFQGTYVQSRELLINVTGHDLTKNPSELATIKTSSLFGIVDSEQTYGLIFGKMLASQGMKQLESFSKTLPLGWAKLSKGMAVWDFTTASYHETPTGSSVFLCVNPEGTQEEFNYGLGRLSQLRIEEHKSRTNIRNLVLFIQQECGLTSPYGYDAERDEDEDEQVLHILGNYGYHKNIVKMARSIPAQEDLMDAFKQTVDPAPEQEFNMSKQVALTQTMHFLFAIAKHSNVIEVLHFHKTPLLDRRLIAIILRACPHVKMIGIYECPMLHLGDVICLLDLIHEVNLERDELGLPRVESLDFYPRYHAGMPYKSQGEFETYGYSWKGGNNEVSQRGVLAIVMLAVLKSRKMKIGLLMDEDAAFMTFLSNIPMVPGKVFAFLDGLYRLLDLKAAKSKDENAVKQAMYDLLKAVRSGLVSLKRDYPKYYLMEMGKQLLFCSSCGYEFLSEFFGYSPPLYSRPESLTCAGCILREKLDEEEDHQKIWSRDIMTGFYPDWNPTDFNVDAPILADGRDLVRFKNAKVERDPIPSQVLLPNGDFHQPDYEIELVRDRKHHWDCVQGLPTLTTLLKADGLRQKARDAALIADSERSLALYMRTFPHLRTRSLQPTLIRMVNEIGTPNHYDEHQGAQLARRRSPAKCTHTFSTAIDMYMTLDEPFKDALGPYEHPGDDTWTPNGKVKDGFW